MKTTIKTIAAAFLCLLIIGCGNATIKGVVTADGLPLEGVLVSDGTEFVQTDANGCYQLVSTKKSELVYLITPSGYYAESSDGIQPGFWAPLTKSADKCERHDFRLKSQDQGKYAMLFVTDVHLCNWGEVKPDKKHFEEAILPLLKRRKAEIEEDKPSYIINLGDLSHDRFWYENDFDLEKVYGYLKQVGFPGPLYSVSGNHDHDPSKYVEDEKEEEFLASHLYRKVFGPDRYSLNIGADHWVVMNNAQYLNTPGEDICAKGIVGARNYNRQYTDEQLDWLEKDLSFIKDGTRVFLCSHIPYYNHFKIKTPTSQLARLDSLFAAHKTVGTLFAGHSHRFIFPEREEYSHIKVITLPATSGSMWETAGTGKSLSMDGCPAGVFSAEFQGTDKPVFKYVAESGEECYYKAYDMNSVRNFMLQDSLMKVSLPQLDSRYQLSDKKWKNTVAVNCWWCRNNDKVEMWENGRKLQVNMTRKCPDPEMLVRHLMFCDPMRKGQNLGKRCEELCDNNIYYAKTRTSTKPVQVRIFTEDGKIFNFTIDRPSPFEVVSE